MSINLVSATTTLALLLLYSLTPVYGGCSRFSEDPGQPEPKDLNEYPWMYISTTGHVEVPLGETKIKKYAFHKCENLVSISIPDSVVDIGESAFDGTGLVSVVLPPHLYYIGRSTFINNKFLKNVTFGPKLAGIGVSAFANNEALENIYLPPSLMALFPTAFAHCSHLTNVTFNGPRIQFVNTDVFDNCERLKTVNFPTNVVNISGAGFPANLAVCPENTLPGEPKCVCDLGSENLLPTDSSYFECAQCPVGYSKTEKSRGKCEKCTFGTFASEIGQERCDLCPTGKFSTVLGSISISDCVDCPEGTYSSSVGLSYCRRCPPGSFCPNSGMSAYNDCPVGRFVSDPGKKECKPCDPGHYQPELGRAVCLPCGVGKHLSGQGANSSAMCVDCPAGTFADKAGLGNCTLCPLGQVQPSTGSVSCLPCGALDTNNAARTSCVRNSALFSASIVEEMFAKGVALSLAFAIAAGFAAMAAGLHYAKINFQFSLHRDNGADVRDDQEKRDVEGQEVVGLGMLKWHQVILKAAFPGLGFGSEIFLIIGMVSGGSPGLGGVMLAFRLLHLVTVVALGMAVLMPESELVRRNSFLNRLSDSASLHKDFVLMNVPLVGAFAFACFCDVTVIQMLPWGDSKFFRSSQGYPSIEVMKLCLVVESIHAVVSVVCQLVYLGQNHEDDDPTTSNQARALFGLSITFTMISLFLGLITFFLRGTLLSEAEGQNGEERSDRIPPQRASKVEMHTIYEGTEGDNDVLTMRSNPMHDAGGRAVDSGPRASMISFENNELRAENADLRQEVEAQKEEIAMLKQQQQTINL